MLIALGGLPGAGKTTIARLLAGKLAATHLRIDTIEQALLRAGSLAQMGPEGYLIAYALAADNLKLGHIVIADSVNPLSITREAWRETAQEAGARLLEVEIVCSNATEHRARVESRAADISGHQLPNWKAVADRGYEIWESADLRIDTTLLTAEQAAARIVGEVETRWPGSGE
ncbi:adenylyl-sulfate kinase [Chromobacterium alticapitis]|uniref:Adenylyl-sulfate kinase n=1 Tax=Chromobacterium alticapitis TaxID=2073169 RepID=A0A2S5DLP2_9NEIS|nr:adenylyl-sulfate kinase [Chromobacterium alticapitis]